MPLRPKHANRRDTPMRGDYVIVERRSPDRPANDPGWVGRRGTVLRVQFWVGGPPRYVVSLGPRGSHVATDQAFWVEEIRVAKIAQRLRGKQADSEAPPR